MFSYPQILSLIFLLEFMSLVLNSPVIQQFKLVTKQIKTT